MEGRAVRLIFHGEADGEDAVVVNPLADFFKTGGFDKLIRFPLAAAAHHPVGAAVFVAGEGAGDHFELQVLGCVDIQASLKTVAAR